jgi:hypothetical protein
LAGGTQQMGVFQHPDGLLEREEFISSLLS